MCTICLCSQVGACQHVWGSSPANIVRSAVSRAEGCHDTRNIGVSRRHHPRQTVPHLQLLWREARQNFLLLCCHARALRQERLEACDAEVWLHPCMRSLQSSRSWWSAVKTFCSRWPFLDARTLASALQLSAIAAILVASVSVHRGASA